jgi:MarR family transcriptional regulator, 2-MHQ and catechol-resistance regulon repressor
MEIVSLDTKHGKARFRRQSTPIRVGPDFDAEYRGASRLSTETVINLGRAWFLAEIVFNRVLDSRGLSITAFNVLEILRGSGQPLPPSVIADHMLVTRGAMTKVLDSLEKRGLARRQAQPGDRRMLLAQITPRGMDLMNDLLPRLHGYELAWLAGALTDAEQDTLIRLLGNVDARFPDLHATFWPEVTPENTHFKEE